LREERILEFDRECGVLLIQLLIVVVNGV
jgi:hypothetical protein